MSEQERTSEDVAGAAVDESVRAACSYRVVLVSWSSDRAAEVAALLPERVLPERASLPSAVMRTDAGDQARTLARDLALLGCGVVIVEHVGEGVVVCAHHGAELSTGQCRECSAPICPSCRLSANGAARCPDCQTDWRRQAQWTRTRQLFVLFVLVALLYQVQRLQTRVAVDVAPIESARVAVMQFVPPTAYHHALVRGLSGFNPEWGGPSLIDVAEFFNRERRRYTGTAGSAISLSVRGPWRGTPKPPGLPVADEGWIEWVRTSWRYTAFWNRLSEQHGVDRTLWNARLFVVYQPGAGDIAAESRASDSAQFAVAYVALDDANPVYPALTIAHELAHALGATDKYDVDGLAEFPEGYLEPFADPLYPQAFAELMAVDVPTGRASEREPIALTEMRIGYRTAAELGWISHDVADAYYLTGGPSPSELLRSGIGENAEGWSETEERIAPEGFVEGASLPSQGSDDEDDANSVSSTDNVEEVDAEPIGR